MPLSLSDEADEDLRQIYLYGFERYGMDATDRYADRLNRALSLIADHPRIGRARHELGGAVRAYPVLVHVIVYEVTPDDDVFVLRIRHGREDWAGD